MPLPRVLRLAIIAGVVATALCALPATGSATSPRCRHQPNLPVCKQEGKHQQLSDRQKGITPACRSAADKWQSAVNAAAGTKRTVGQFKAAVKKAKSDKAKKKAKKGLKKAKKAYAKAKKPVPGLRSAMVTQCASAKVKPY
jgi:hypothetical protein